MNKYYYIDSGKQQIGPMEIEELKTAGIGPDTMVWCQGMATWTPAAEVEELKILVGPKPEPYCSAPPVSPAYTSGTPAGVCTPPSQQCAPERPNNWLWLAIVCTACCCLPLGIVSIMFSTKVNSCYDAGDYAGAEDNAKKAKMWGFIGLGLGAVGGIIYFIIVFLSALAS